jgi:hypothetical protein
MTSRSLRLPDHLNGAIAEIARREHRSVNAQIIVLLEMAVKTSEPSS